MMISSNLQCVDAKEMKKKVRFFLCQNSCISNLSTKCHCKCLGEQTLIRKNYFYYYDPKLIFCESIFYKIFRYLNENTIEYLNVERAFVSLACYDKEHVRFALRWTALIHNVNRLNYVVAQIKLVRIRILEEK